MREAGDGRAGDRMRALIVVLWRAGLRIQEALDLYERDLDQRRGALLIRSGKGGRRREVGMDEWVASGARAPALGVWWRVTDGRCCRCRAGAVLCAGQPAVSGLSSCATWRTTVANGASGGVTASACRASTT
jgi:hypothetical protein